MCVRNTYFKYVALEKPNDSFREGQNTQTENKQVQPDVSPSGQETSAIELHLINQHVDLEVG